MKRPIKICVLAPGRLLRPTDWFTGCNSDKPRCERISYLRRKLLYPDATEFGGWIQNSTLERVPNNKFLIYARVYTS